MNSHNIDKIMDNVIDSVIESVLQHPFHLLCKKCRISRHDPIFNQKTFKNFLEYISSFSSKDRIKELRSHDNNGYSFVHSIIWTYVTEKPYFKSPEISQEYLKIIYWVLSNINMEELLELFSEGMPDDDKCTPIHDLVSLSRYLNKDDYELLEALKNKGLETIFQISDGNDMTVYDYIKMKSVHIDYKKKIYEVQKQMKDIEKNIINVFTEDCLDCFNLCENCGNFLSLVKDLKKIPEKRCLKILTEEMRLRIQKIIELRIYIMDIFKKILKDERKQSQHSHYIEIWTKMLEIKI